MKTVFVFQGEHIQRFKNRAYIIQLALKRLMFIVQYYSRKFVFLFGKKQKGITHIYSHNFPAVHFKLDSWNHVLNFSSEIIVAVLVLLASGLNLYFFSFQGKDFADKSLSAKWLSYHTELNPGLYAEQTSIRTIVSSPKLIAEAFADNQSITDPTERNTAASNDSRLIDESMISENAIVKTTPDSIEQLISQQFKVHIVSEGETLSGISKDFGVSENTLIWTNKLSDYTILPGWELLIPPTDGVLAQIDQETTVAKLAKTYGVDKATILAFNGMSDEKVEAGRFIMIPGGKIAPKIAETKGSKKNSGYSGKLTPGSHIFPAGYCTWYVASKIKIPWHGNAKEWPTNARAFGAVLTSKPIPGAIVVTSDNSRYGHVALVEEVNPDGTFIISEMNFKAFATVNKRTLNVSDKRIRTFIVYNN